MFPPIYSPLEIQNILMLTQESFKVLFAPVTRTQFFHPDKSKGHKFTGEVPSLVFFLLFIFNSLFQVAFSIVS